MREQRFRSLFDRRFILAEEPAALIAHSEVCEGGRSS